MARDREAFRERFKAYKNGKSVSEIYDAGLPRYGGGKRGFSTTTKKQIDRLYKVLQAKGFDAISAAGIIGNAIQESSLNPDSVNRFGYSGLFLNSKQIRKAIEDQYGDYSYDSQLRYLDDWTSGNTWIRKGKHRDYTAAGSGAFRRTGYKTVHDAADAFMKLYERPVIMKDGKIIGYLDWDKRRAYALQVHDYLTGVQPVMETVIEEKPITQTTAAEYNDVHQFQPVRLNTATPDYSMTNPAPASISAINDANGPTFTLSLLNTRRAMLNIGNMRSGLFDINKLAKFIDTGEVEDLAPANIIPENGFKPIIRFKDGKLPMFGGGRKPNNKRARAIYNYIDPRNPYPESYLEAAKLEAAVRAKMYFGNPDQMEYEVGDDLPSKVSDAAWRKRLGYDYDNKFLIPHKTGVRLPADIEKEIPTDTTMLKNRINRTEELMRYSRKYKNNPYIKLAKLVDQEALDALRKTYKTGQPVTINEHAFNSRQWVSGGKITPTMSPLNVLLNYTIQYDPSTNRMMYKDVYDFNQYDWAIPGDPFEISGYVDLPSYKNGKSPIHIKPANRGKLTALKKRTGKSEAELYKTGGPSVRKMITFARNARKWKH